MVKTSLDERVVEKAVLGSVVLAAGGGGRMELGLRLGQIAVELGHASQVSVDALSSKAEVVAVAALDDGAREPPSYRLAYHRRAVELLAANGTAEFGGLIPVGAGALNVMACWGQAALLDIPLIDASFESAAHPCRWRAFVDLLARDIPAMSLAAVGQSGDGEELETFLRGDPRAIRRVMEQLAGAVGSYALCFGPLPLAWARTHVAVGRISGLIEIGEALKRAAPDGGRMAAQAVNQMLDGETIMPATVVGASWTTRQAASFGVVRLLDETDRRVSLTYWHRYVALEGDDGRLATFPDVIVTLGARGTPLQADELSEGQDVFIVTAPPQLESSLVSVDDEALPHWLTYHEVERASTAAVAACTEDGLRP